MGTKATSFFEQAPEARRDYFAVVRDVGDAVEKFTGDPRGDRVTSRCGASKSAWGPKRSPL
jgi:hypothetical protein